MTEKSIKPLWEEDFNRKEDNVSFISSCFFINKTFTTWGLETIADIKNGCGYLSAALP